jgi:hypothetical protein
MMRVDADPGGPPPGEPSAQLVAEARVTFELTERIQDRTASARAYAIAQCILRSE